jgi:hypothetical protein
MARKKRQWQQRTERAQSDARRAARNRAVGLPPAFDPFTDPLPPGFFCCATCGTVARLVDLDASISEAQAVWGVADPERDPDMVLVCRDCWEYWSPQEIWAMGEAYQGLRHPDPEDRAPRR